MVNELAKAEGQSLTALDIRMQVNLIQEVMKAVMKENEHYGKIPGCGEKLTLLKAGAEKLLSTFKIAAEPVVEDLSVHDEARYRVTVKGLSMTTGAFLGAGIGECSSNEEKYKWKKSICDEEYDSMPEDRRRIKWFVPYNKPKYSVKQIRTNPADVANTVLKMAKKRSQIDMALTVTAASDIFTQDIEDPDDLMDSGEAKSSGKPATTPPQTKIETANKATETKIDVIPMIRGKVLNAELHKYKSGKVKTDYTILTDEEKTIVVSEWKEPNPEIIVETIVEAINVKVSDYQGKLQYTAESIKIVEPEIEFGK